jgi:GMP synthase-like glutamine amidotransferase
MKPIAIFRHAALEGPGFFAKFLDQQAIPWQLISVDQGEPIPKTADAYSGLVFMGGPMSVNDDLPWIPKILDLIRDAYGKEIPLLGHCLGGQLIAKALGGTVTRNPVKEIGWGTVTVTDNKAAKDWFGRITQFDAFHWHGETFTLPPGAELVLSSPCCANQAFSIGRHLGMQCHIEMTAEMIRDWCAAGADEIETATPSSAVQSVETIQREMQTNLSPLQGVAEKVYAQWVRGLRQA